MSSEVPLDCVLNMAEEQKRENLLSWALYDKFLIHLSVPMA